MKLAIAISLFVGASLLGCSPGGLSVTGTKCSGDLGSFLAQCITNRGGQNFSINSPLFRAQWTYQFRPNEDIVLIQTNCFSEIRSLLRKAYGDPNFSAGSSAVSPMGSGQSGTYGPKQIGVALNFTGDAKETVICILGQYGSAASPPNPQGGAKGWQPFSSDTNLTPVAAVLPRSP
jgi:hypothetical protein